MSVKKISKEQPDSFAFNSPNVDAIKKIFFKGKSGNTYNIGGSEELSNIKLVKLICRKLDIIKPRKNKKKYESLIYLVKDRPGHDLRYALNSSKLIKKLNWSPKVSFSKGIYETFIWYKNNKKYYKSISKKDITKRLGRI